MLHQIAPKYIDTGKAKVVYHNFANIGPESQWAAQAADCAGDQGKFWEYADYLLSHQAGENAGSFSQANLKGFAQALKLNADLFNACLDSGKYQAAIQQEKTQGASLGVQATPTFFVNGQKIEGAPSADRLGALLDGLLQ